MQFWHHQINIIWLFSMFVQDQSFRSCFLIFQYLNTYLFNYNRFYSHQMSTSIFSLISIIIIIWISQPKVIELTDSNLPLILQQSTGIVTLLHHPKCQHSVQYKGKYIQYSHQISKQTVAVVDCSHYVNLCNDLGQIVQTTNTYPTVIKLSSNRQQSQLIDQQQYLYQQNRKYNLEITNEPTEQYTLNQMLKDLKKQPNYIVVLFEEIGMRVPTEDRTENDRVYYLENNGKLAATLKGFIGNKNGCWIYRNVGNSFTLEKYFCGDTYQDRRKLQNILSRFQLQLQNLNGPNKALKQLMNDNSNYQTQEVIGYNQLMYKLSHYQLQTSNLPLQNNQIPILPHKCLYLYQWNRECEFCDRQFDMDIIKTVVGKAYPGEKNQGYAQYQIGSYDLHDNMAIWQEDIIRNIMNKSSKIDQEFYRNKANAGTIIPNILVICYRQSMNMQGQSKLDLTVKTLDKVITHQTVTHFIYQIEQLYKIQSTINTNDTIQL